MDYRNLGLQMLSEEHLQAALPQFASFLDGFSLGALLSKSLAE
jgi:hypothetical protein